MLPANTMHGICDTTRTNLAPWLPAYMANVAVVPSPSGGVAATSVGAEGAKGAERNDGQATRQAQDERAWRRRRTLAFLGQACGHDATFHMFERYAKALIRQVVWVVVSGCMSLPSPCRRCIHLISSILWQRSSVRSQSDM
jgi:hypothetical protein